jgi:osmoprotectant transport system ATP-binding protein
MLRLIDVSKCYGEQTVLERLTLDLPAARTTVLIGPSGCGKSTILRLMTGLIAPDAGTVCFQDTAVGRETILRIRRRIGYVIQEGGLFPHLSAEQNVALMARYLGWDRRRITDRLDALADLTRLPSELLGKYPVQLSGGQRQRVSLMRALMLDPDVLLLDEPLGALDPMIRAELQADLKQIFEALGKTVVLVTHDLSEAAFFGDGIVLMREGRIEQLGSLLDLIERPTSEFVTQFINAQRSRVDRDAGDQG